MPRTSQSLINYLSVVVGAWRGDPHDDATLLAQFAEGGDEAAFRALVGRHGTLVWQTCQRILGDTPDAEDAFQTAFLVLARKAGRFPVESLAGWLHRVARQTAMDVRASVRRRRGLEQQLRTVKQPEAGGDASRAELHAALDEELAGLPERLRVPLLLHYLEGKSQIEVARLLGCSRGVVQYRLARAEATLRKRLERRGLTVGAGSVAVLLGSTGEAPAVPALLIGTTVRAALRSLSCPLESSTSAALTERVMKAILATKKIKMVLVLLGLTLCLGGSGALAYRALARNTTEPLQPAGESSREGEVTHQPGADQRAAVRVDCHGDPLPEGALARLGTVRLRPPGMVRSAVFSPDGKTVASVGRDSMVHLWEATSGKEIRTLRWYEAEGLSVSFSSDGKTVASGDSGGKVHLWETATGKEIHTLRRHKADWVPSVAFASDSKTVASAGHDGTVRLWEVGTGKEIRTLQGHKGGVCSVAFSSDGKTIASGAEDKTVRLWEAATGKEICTLQGHQGGVFSVVFSPDGKTVVSGGRDGTVRLWEVATGKEIRTLQGHKDQVRSVAFSPDGRIVASGGDDSIVRLWEVATGKEIRTLQGHKMEVLSVAFSSDGKTVASGGYDKTLRLWNVATGKEIPTLQGHKMEVLSVVFSSDGRTVVSGGGDGTVRLWETATGKEIHTRQGLQGSVRKVAISSDCKTVASAGNDNTVRLWEMVTGKEVHILEGHQRPVDSVAFTSDRRTVASGGRDGTLRLWEVVTGKEISTLQGHKSGVCSVALSSDGKIVASVSDGTIRLWEVVTGKEISTLQGHKGGVFSVAFSSDGKTVASGGVDGTVRLWEVATGKEVRKLKGHQGLVCSVAFSSDGKIVASGGEDKAVRLWEAATGKEIRTLLGHKGQVLSVAFASDDRTLASVSTDTTGLIWDVASLTRLKPIRVHPLPLPTLSEEQQLEAAWTALSDADPARAYPALWKLTRSPTQAIALLQARLRPVAPLVDLHQLQRWIANLDDDSFTVRDKTQREITKLGEPALPALRQALQGRPSAEVRRRLKDLLAELEPKGIVVSPDRLRELRAVQVLESIGTVEARRVLHILAQGASGARLTVEAQSALDRLAKRSVTKP